MTDRFDERKITWIAVLQGWSMLLVILGHVNLNNQLIDTAHPLANWIHSTVYSFHMPLFMLISGYLLYMTRIAKKWGYGKLIVDKLKRLYVPMLFFTVLTFAAKVIFAPLMKHPEQLTISHLADTFLFYKINPLVEMWFVISLLVIMTLYPLYRKACEKLVYELIFFAVLVIINIIDIKIQYFQLNYVAYMLPFFYCGVLICKYDITKYISNIGALIVCTFVFFAALEFDNNVPSQLLALFGILFSLSLCINLTKVMPKLFSSFRDYTYQIFLMGIFCQMGVIYLYSKEPNIIPYWILYMLSITLGIYIPVVISKAIKCLKNKYINRCFGL